MATSTFSKLFFSQIKASLADWVETHVKNAGPQSIWFFHLDHNLKDDDKIFLFYFRYQSSATSGLFPNELIERQK